MLPVVWMYSTVDAVSSSEVSKTGEKQRHKRRWTLGIEHQNQADWSIIDRLRLIELSREGSKLEEDLREGQQKIGEEKHFFGFVTSNTAISAKEGGAGLGHKLSRKDVLKLRENAGAIAHVMQNDDRKEQNEENRLG